MSGGVELFGYLTLQSPARKDENSFEATGRSIVTWTGRDSTDDATGTVTQTRTR